MKLVFLHLNARKIDLDIDDVRIDAIHCGAQRFEKHGALKCVGSVAGILRRGSLIWRENKMQQHERTKWGGCFMVTTRMQREFSGYLFERAHEIQILRTETGEVAEYVHTLPPTIRLNSHAAGPFCEFRLLGLPADSGVYAVTANDDLKYIGECKNLSIRFGPTGYARIDRRNCHSDGQSTNCKINSLILKSAKEGQTVVLWFHATQSYKAVETSIIDELNPPWNSKKSRKTTYTPKPSTASPAKVSRNGNLFEDPGANKFRQALEREFSAALMKGLTHIILDAGQLHRAVGGYPGKNHKMPTCCSVMKSAMIPSDRIVADPPKGIGASLAIDYSLPRHRHYS